MKNEAESFRTVISQRRAEAPKNERLFNIPVPLGETWKSWEPKVVPTESYHTHTSCFGCGKWVECWYKVCANNEYICFYCDWCL